MGFIITAAVGKIFLCICRLSVPRKVFQVVFLEIVREHSIYGLRIVMKSKISTSVSDDTRLRKKSGSLTYFATYFKENAIKASFGNF